jgi:hypothetical protein
MSRAQKLKLAVAAGATLATALITGCGASGAPGRPGHPDPLHFLSVEAAAHTVRFTLALGYDREASFQNIDGATKGALLFSVPVGWRLSIQCANRAQATRYACALAGAPGAPVAQRGIVYVAHPPGGLAPGQAASFSLLPKSPGRYRMLALSQSGGEWSAAAGMWVVLRVVSGGVPQARWLR